jgi:hypothetical protein
VLINVTFALGCSLLILGSMFFSKTLVVELLLGGYIDGTLVCILILVSVWKNQVEGYNLVLIFLWCPYYPIWWFDYALVGM